MPTARAPRPCGGTVPRRRASMTSRRRDGDSSDTELLPQEVYVEGDRVGGWVDSEHLHALDVQYRARDGQDAVSAPGRQPGALYQGCLGECSRAGQCREDGTQSRVVE